MFPLVYGFSYKETVMWSFEDFSVVQPTSCWRKCQVASDLRKHNDLLTSLLWQYLYIDELPIQNLGVVSLTFRELSKIIQCQKSHSWWEFQGETLYVCPEHGFAHLQRFTLKSHKKYNFCKIQISIIYILESSRNVSETCIRHRHFHLRPYNTFISQNITKNC